MENQKPTVGRIVHYQSYGTPGGEYLPEPRAAVVTEVIAYNPDVSDSDNKVVSLAILNPTGMFFTKNVQFSETPKPGHWNWPPRA